MVRELELRDAASTGHWQPGPAVTVQLPQASQSVTGQPGDRDRDGRTGPAAISSLGIMLEGAIARPSSHFHGNEMTNTYLRSLNVNWQTRGVFLSFRDP